MAALTRKEQKARTRAGLLAKAEQLFAANGIGVTSTAEIALSLNVSHGTVFVHFATRPELLAAVVESFAARLLAALQSDVLDGASLKEVLRSHVSVLSQFEDFYLRVISEPQSLPPAAFESMQSVHRWVSSRLAEAARGPMRTGAMKKVGADPFFQTWMALVNYQVMNRHVFSSRKPVLQANGEMLLGYFLLLMKTEMPAARVVTVLEPKI